MIAHRGGIGKSSAYAPSLSCPENHTGQKTCAAMWLRRFFKASGAVGFQASHSADTRRFFFALQVLYRMLTTQTITSSDRPWMI